ncbi:MAG: S1C family serine protease [Opitutales bacterium]
MRPSTLKPLLIRLALLLIPALLAAESRVFLGVVSDSVSRSTRAQLGLEEDLGISFDTVVAGSAAEAAGLRDYDILIAWDDQMIFSEKQFSALLNRHRPGDTVNLTILRNGEEQTRAVTLGERGKRYTGPRAPDAPGGGDTPEAPTAPDPPAGEWDDTLREAMEAANEALEWVDEVESLDNPEEIRKRIEQVRESLQGGRATVVHTDASGRIRTTSRVDLAGTQFMLRDDKGVIRVRQAGGDRIATILDPEGEILFSGNLDRVNREALPDNIQQRLNQIDAMIRTGLDEETDIQVEETTVAPAAEGDIG